MIRLGKLKKTLSLNYGLELGHDRGYRRGFFPYLKIWCFRLYPGWMNRPQGESLVCGRDYRGFIWDFSPFEWLSSHLIWKTYTIVVIAWIGEEGTRLNLFWRHLLYRLGFRCHMYRFTLPIGFSLKN